MKCTDGGSDMPHSLIRWIFIVCATGWSISKIVRASEKAGGETRSYPAGTDKNVLTYALIVAARNASSA